MAYEVPIALAVGVLIGGLLLERVAVKWLRSLAAKTSTQVDDVAVRETSRAVRLLTLLALLYIVLTVVNVDAWFIVALAVLVVGKGVVNIVSTFFREYVDMLPIEKDQKGVLLAAEGALKAVLYAVTVLVALATLGIDVWPILTSLGIGGLAVSLALKDVLTDYVAGFIVILGRSLKRGQRVLVKDKGVEGLVEEIGWRYTTLVTDNGERVTIPNRVISSSVIIFKEGGK